MVRLVTERFKPAAIYYNYSRTISNSSNMRGSWYACFGISLLFEVNEDVRGLFRGHINGSTPTFQLV